MSNTAIEEFEMNTATRGRPQLPQSAFLAGMTHRARQYMPDWPPGYSWVIEPTSSVIPDEGHIRLAKAYQAIEAAKAHVTIVSLVDALSDGFDRSVGHFWQQWGGLLQEARSAAEATDLVNWDVRIEARPRPATMVNMRFEIAGRRQPKIRTNPFD